jgi:hypothetical protein
MAAPGDLWTCTCACDDRAGGPQFEAAIVGCAPIGLSESVGADRDTACAVACNPPVETLGFHELGYIGPCRAPVIAADGFADGHLTGPSSCDPTQPLTSPLTEVAAYHATVDPSLSTMTLDAVDHIAGPVAGTIAFDFQVPLRFNPNTMFFENIQLASQTDPAVQVFEANNVFAGYDPTGAFASSGVLPVRWRDASGARGINPQSSTRWQGQLDLTARTLVLDVAGADPSDASWTFSMHVEATVGDLPPVANAGGDLTVPCTSTSGTPVTLDASASADPDSNDAVVRYQWLGFGGSPAFGHDAMTTVMLPVGTSTFEVHVYDRGLGADSQKKTVTVTSSASCP